MAGGRGGQPSPANYSLLYRGIAWLQVLAIAPGRVLCSSGLYVEIRGETQALNCRTTDIWLHKGV